MKDENRSKMSWDAWDETVRPAAAMVGFDQVVDAALSRRGFLRSVLAIGSGAAVMGVGSLLGSGSAQAQAASRFAFAPIDIATDATVHVPAGYNWQPLVKWGQPLFSDAPAFDSATGGTSASAVQTFGENTDGMELFDIGGRQVIAVNHEYANPDVNLPGNDDDGMPASADDVLKLQNVQGISVFELAQGPDGWAPVVDSEFNRRITNNTPMVLSGPAAGHALLQTAADPTGTQVLGTLNNCGAGRTPWGTYLTCEENFNGYFGSTTPDAALPDGFDRYGISTEGRYAYEKFDARFDIAQTPNEPHRFGYIVEINPADPTSTPVKHTALGRFKHENAALTIASDGRVVVYMGDDERGEFLYKWVSAGSYVAGGDTSGLLEDGQLYAAKFNPDTTGSWVALTPDATGMDATMICIHTRQAASAVGATTMDRPEWVAINPVAVQAYCCLTNNSKRAVDATNAGGDVMIPVADSPNPRAENEYGQIVRWMPDGQDHASDSFTWDLYVMAGNPVVHADAYAGSANITPGNMFNSPDGMKFDSTGMLWIQTDGEDSNEEGFAGMGNNQMLVGDPVSGEIARFLTGPKGCEVTGSTWSTDLRTMFVGIQHPGGSFPDGAGLPRSTVIAIRRDDGGVIG